LGRSATEKNTIRFATCFDPVGSSSGLHYEPVNVRKLRTFLGSEQNVRIPRMYAAFKHKLVRNEGLVMTLQDRNM